MARPTDKQIAFATSLGIDIPDNVSRSGITELIDHVLSSQRREDHGGAKLSNEEERTASRGFGGMSSSDARLSLNHRMLQVFRDSGIVVGDVILEKDIGSIDTTAVLISADAIWSRVRRLGNAYSLRLRTVDRDTMQMSYELLCHPPTGFVSAYYLCDLLYRGRKQSRKHLQEFAKWISERLDPGDKFTHDKAGEFWLEASARQVEMSAMRQKSVYST